MTERPFDETTLEAAGELLALGRRGGVGLPVAPRPVGRREGFGITFAPDPDGWAVGYVRGMAGDNLVVATELGEAARAAVSRLLDVAAEYPQPPPDAFAPAAAASQ